MATFGKLFTDVGLAVVIGVGVGVGVGFGGGGLLAGVGRKRVDVAPVVVRLESSNCSYDIKKSNEFVNVKYRTNKKRTNRDEQIATRRS